MSVETPEQRHDDRRHGERRRNNRRTSDPEISPPYYAVFDRMAVALERIENALETLAAPPAPAEIRRQEPPR